MFSELPIECLYSHRCPLDAEACAERKNKGFWMMQNRFFPPWDEIHAEHVEPGIRHIISVLGDELADLEKNVKPDWKGLVEPLERISDRISRAWGIVSHLKAVKDSPKLREAVDSVQGERVKLSLRMSQSKPLYEAFQALKDGETWGTLSGAQQRIVENELRDFVLGGVALEGEVRQPRSQNCSGGAFL